MLFLPIKLTVPLFNVARRPRPAPHFKRTMSKPVAPLHCKARAAEAMRVEGRRPHLVNVRAPDELPGAPCERRTSILAAPVRLSRRRSGVQRGLSPALPPLRGAPQPRRREELMAILWRSGQDALRSPVCLPLSCRVLLQWARTSESHESGYGQEEEQGPARPSRGRTLKERPNAEIARDRRPRVFIPCFDGQAGAGAASG